MNILLLLIWNSVSVVVMQTCREFQIHNIIHKNKFVNKQPVSCVTGLSLEQCALECLLVAMCASINYKDHIKQTKTMCEMNSDRDGDSDFNEILDKRYVYVDIREWPQGVAGTCVSRPCAENQRCIPTIPYRCIDIDCGTPPVLPYDDADVNMYPLPTTTTLGSIARYACRDPKKAVILMYDNSSRCYDRFNRMCNSDFSWTHNEIVCVEL